MKTVAIVACSNGQKEEYRSQNEELARYLEKTGHKVLWSNDIYEKNAAFSGTGAERAAELMRFFNDPEVEEIYDISGGDLANQVLDGLDYAAIRRSRAVFWGYSDLTTVINAHLCTDRKKQRALSGQEHGLGRGKRGAAAEI